MNKEFVMRWRSNMDKVKSIKETFAQLKELSERRGYITKDRFVGYAKVKLACSEREVQSLWGIWEHIVELNWFRLDEINDSFLNAALDIADEVYKSVCKGADVRYAEESPKTPKWKVYYRIGENSETQHMGIDLRNKEDVLKYALLLQQEEAEVLLRLDFFDTVEVSYGRVSMAKKKKIDIYNGDIIFCSDKDSYGWGNSSGVYICTMEGYKKLMYTQGRGYLRRGEPDFEQGKDGDDILYSNYAFNAYDKRFDVVGNIYVDRSVLMEENED